MKGKKRKGLWIYLIQVEGTDFTKIGFSENPKKRLSDLQTANPHKLNMIAMYQSVNHKTEVKLAERFLHKKFKGYNVRGEWFSCVNVDVVTDLLYEHFFKRLRRLERKIENRNNQRICMGIQEAITLLPPRPSSE